MVAWMDPAVYKLILLPCIKQYSVLNRNIFLVKVDVTPGNTVYMIPMRNGVVHWYIDSVSDCWCILIDTPIPIY